ncbi:zinc finger protein 26-like [Diorhabda carinulata]|uniref:zinc finger protein 26-like n=1 Tax=Diorhabda carinulata TaxID=1163345 RepID=UPI0025A1E830|nr:zinc finger protein 26-like [Diorhabda carinulata]
MEDRANILRQMKVCRFCLCNEETDLLNIHEKHPQDPEIPIPLPSLPLRIMGCIAIEVIQNDGMPQYICKSCCHLTTQAYIFKMNCKKADDALKLFLVTGQLSKPYMQNAVQIKVQLAPDKFITVVNENEKSNAATIQQEFENNKEIEVEFQDGEQHETERVLYNTNDEAEATNDSVSKYTEVEKVETSIFPCEYCEKTFPLKQLLDLHMSQHSRERNFICEICKCKFYTKYDLQKHIRTHNPIKEFSCSLCDKTFNREPLLRRHIKTHDKEPKFTCQVCNVAFLRKELLEYHMEKHNKKKAFTCKICNKSFVFKQGLERHEAVHSNNKPHKCNYCDASFISAIKLTRHITSHAGLRPYPCKLCGRTFLLSHHLTRHMRGHYATNDSIGPYKCHICSMSFRTSEILINHSAIHSMVNLKCVICNTTFETAELVKEHITTHLSGLPYSCGKCEYSFETEMQLEEHELDHAEMEYEEQIEKEVFKGSSVDGVDDDEQNDTAEDEAMHFTIDVDNPELTLQLTQKSTEKKSEDVNRQRIEFLKDEVDLEEDVQEEGGDEEMEVVESEPIKPIVRQEGTKVYQRRNAFNKNLPDVSSNPLKPTPAETVQQTATTAHDTLLDSTTLQDNKVKMGDKIVKVQKFIFTKDEMKAMAKQGILEVKGGQVVLKSAGQQILNASLKPMQKNEIDSLLDKRINSGVQVRKFDRKSDNSVDT